MKFLILFFALLATSQAALLFSEQELDNQFEQFKNDFSREYKDDSEEQRRRSIFADNYDYILRHNREVITGAHSYILGVNNFTDLSTEEFVQQMNGFKGAMASPTANWVHIDETIQGLPDTVDWTTKGVVTPIKNQGQCGSCWAFSAVASIEGQHALKTGKLVSLSEQNLVDCSYGEGDLGCFGGLMDNAFKYVIDNKGIDTETAYPYTASYFELCKFKKPSIGATISSFVDVKKNCENSLQNAVATVGPISVAIDASQKSFQLYKSGVYDEPACSSTKLDHGVTAVGYGSLNGKDYWKVKNSWGTSWGEQGYILMSRNKQNQCGIAAQASYPQV